MLLKMGYRTKKKFFFKNFLNLELFKKYLPLFVFSIMPIISLFTWFLLREVIHYFENYSFLIEIYDFLHLVFYGAFYGALSYISFNLKSHSKLIIVLWSITAFLSDVISNIYLCVFREFPFDVLSIPRELLTVLLPFTAIAIIPLVTKIVQKNFYLFCLPQ